jgi:membrane-bound ClpP family serine protease
MRMKTLGIAVLVLGLLAMAYGGFSYTQDTTALKLGSIELSVAEKKRVNVPLWAGMAAAIAGGALLVLGSRKP